MNFCIEPDILECKAKWALGSITMNKGSGGDGIPVELFQILKNDAVTHYANKDGKLSSGHRTGKGQFFFQSQRKAMPNNGGTIIQVCSFHMLVRLYSKSFKLGFSSTWTENSQMYNPGLEKAKEPETKLPTSIRSSRQQENSRKTSTSISLNMLKPLMVCITKNVENC